MGASAWDKKTYISSNSTTMIRRQSLLDVPVTK